MSVSSRPALSTGGGSGSCRNTVIWALKRPPTPPFPTYARPPLIFPVPLTETKILSSVTYGCIINEIRICIVLRTRNGVWCWGGGGNHCMCAHNTGEPRCARSRQSSMTKLVCDVAHDNQSDSTEERGARLLSCHLCCSGIP